MPRYPRKRPPRAPRRPPRDLSTYQDEWAYVVAEGEHGMRLDHYLQVHFPWRSRTVLHELIAEGRVLLAGRPARRKAARVSAGAPVVIHVPPPPEEERHEELARSLVVVHEDEDLVAIAKPAGMIVHPVGRKRVNTLIQALHWRYRRGEAARRPIMPRICHRLDRETSGVVVVAKNDLARRKLQDVFEAREVEKEYVAVVRGVVAEGEGRIDRPIGPHPLGKIRTQMTVREDGLPSATRFRVLERFLDATAVRFDLETGRQHQIRVHAQSIGHPVLLDPLYGEDEPRAYPAPPARPAIQRHALHARRIAFAHPRTGARVEVTAEVPEDMLALVAALRSNSSSVAAPYLPPFFARSL